MPTLLALSTHLLIIALLGSASYINGQYQEGWISYEEEEDDEFRLLYVPHSAAAASNPRQYGAHQEHLGVFGGSPSVNGAVSGTSYGGGRAQPPGGATEGASVVGPSGGNSWDVGQQPGQQQQGPAGGYVGMRKRIEERDDGDSDMEGQDVVTTTRPPQQYEQQENQEGKNERGWSDGTHQNRNYIPYNGLPAFEAFDYEDYVDNIRSGKHPIEDLVEYKVEMGTTTSLHSMQWRQEP